MREMMANPLQNALKKLIENQASPDEIELLRQAFSSGQFFIGGNVRNSVIIVGSGNSVQLTAEALQHLTANSEAGNISALHQLPQPPTDFTGRKKEFKSILTSIHKKRGIAISGLTGMGGVGKTALGLVIAHELAREYSDAQFFIDLRGTGKRAIKPVEVMRYVIQGFNPKADLTNASESELAGTYQSTLSNKKVILFLDNVRDSSQVTPLIPPSTCCVLITSRWQFAVPGLLALRLDVLNEKDSVQLLTEICPRLDKQSSRQIASLCGYLPIALRLAGGFLQVHSDWSPAEYIAQLSKKNEKLKALHFEGSDLKTLFNLSYKHLPKNEQKYWNMLSVFSTSFRREAISAIWKLDDETTHQLASKLCQYSLLEYDLIADRYKLHDLLADFAKTKIPESDKLTSSLNYFRYYQNVWKTAEEHYTKGDDEIAYGLQLFDSEHIHIETAYERAITDVNMREDIAVILKDIPDFIEIARLRFHPNTQLRWFQAALVVAQKFKDLHNQNKLMGFIGTIYVNLNETKKALEYYEQALEITHNIGDRQRQGFWLGNIGNAYTNLGENRKALEYYEQALEIAHEIGDRQRQGFWLGNIGNAYSNLKEINKALEYYDQALEIAREIGDRRVQSLWFLDIGSIYATLSENNKALEYYEQALEIAREIGDRKNHASCLGNIGLAYSNLSEGRKGIEHYEQALEIARELDDRQSQSLLLGNIGAAYNNLSEHRKSIIYSEQALEISRELGDQKSQSLWLGNIGASYNKLGEYRKAITYYAQSLKIIYSLDDQRQLTELLFSIGYAYGALDEVHESITYVQESLRCARKFGSQYHQSVCLAYLGGAHIVLDENQKALNLLKQALKVAIQIGEQKQICQWTDYIGRVYGNLGKLAQARENLERALKISREFGFRDLEASALCNFAKLSQLKQDKKSALQYAQEARIIFESIKSPYEAEINEFIESLK
jgi:tetratricopeptide (TPR) repeat protein